MKKSQKHHYLPKAAYLSFFSYPKKRGSIYLYHRNKGPTLTNIANAGLEKDLYAFINENGEKDFTLEEKVFGTLDRDLIPTLTSLNNQLSPLQITQTCLLYFYEVLNLATFIAYQLTRTPAFIKKIADVYGEMTKAYLMASSYMEPSFLSRALEAGKNGELNLSEEEIKESFKFIKKGKYKLKSGGQYFTGLALELALKSVPFYAGKKIFLYKSENPFFTSDYPVLLIPDPQMPRKYRGGILGSHVYFPIGNYSALFLKNTWKPTKLKHPLCLAEIPVIQLPNSSVKKFNLLTIKNAEKFIFGGFRDTNIQEKFSKTKTPKKFKVYSPFKNEDN